MAGKKSRYQVMEQYMTYALLADAALFLLYLLFAGLGLVWLKVIFGVIAILLSGLLLGYLYLTKELLKRRSLWMSAAAAAVAACVLVSLIVNFPSPKSQAPEQIISYSVNE